MSLISIAYTQDSIAGTYATFCFQGEDLDAVYAAAEKVDGTLSTPGLNSR